MKLLLHILAFSLIFECPIFSDEIPVKEKKLKILDAIQDPDKRRLVEERVSRIQEQVLSFRPRDRSADSTCQIIDEVRQLRGIMLPAKRKAIDEVLARRSDFKELLHQRIEGFDVSLFDQPNPPSFPLTDPLVYASLASAGGEEFHIETIKKCIDHPIVKKAGVDFLRPFIELLAQNSDANEVAFLDQLIDQGRVKKGSLYEKQWREKLSNRGTNKRLKKISRPHVQPEQNQNSGTDEQADKPVTKTNGLQNKWPIILVIALILGSMFIWLKVKSRKKGSDANATSSHKK